ncbi:hypothetical protein SAMN04490206_3059 [Pseudomonas umsongensis]|jgi:hypothetical protein|nr:hypothetical protein PG5_65940 [Pseudomonas sp. G5(2012)]SDT42297.1 hypothetical protein SAMN04490206_3059 [Pseudomonas umsongensis]
MAITISFWPTPRYEPAGLSARIENRWLMRKSLPSITMNPIFLALAVLPGAAVYST